MRAKPGFHNQHAVPHGRPERRIRVLLVDDHAMVRQGLRTYLDQCADIELVGEAADGEEAVRLADQLSPDVIVMDINMPRMNGIEATRLIISKHPSLRIVGLSFETRPKNREALLRAGASLVLDKGAAREQLPHALYRTVAWSVVALSGGPSSLLRQICSDI